MDLVRVDLFGVDQIDTNNVVISGSSSTAANCEEFLQNINSPPLNNLSEVALSPTMRPQKVRLDLNNSNENTRFFVFSYGTVSQCAQIDDLPGKQVSAMINMKGIKGYFKFQQDSPFSVTELTVNLTNLQSKVGPYHVHLFPVPSLRNPLSSLCSNDNIGGHFNPFGLNTTDPNYPQGPGSTHDRYEIGDLGTKHMSLAGLTEFEGVFEDYNLPLYGQNSIVGRSVVIHELNGARYVCASISYPGEVVVAKATFLSPVVGEVWFTQLKNHHLSDVSVFLDLSYGNPATAPTQNHNWHVHTYPISSERDDSVGRCTTTGGHWNPYGVDTENMNYSMFCSSESPFSCEVGDFTGKFTTLNLSVNVGRVEAKHFFTDVTSWVPGIAGRSIVIHQAERAGPRIACANVTTVRTSNASLRTWYGPGMSNGDIQFTQSLPLGPTEVNVSLTNLNSLAGGYHVHILPIISGQSNPCSDANIRGHFNPLNWDIQNSPAPGVGTLDQYEVGDLSGKFGMLTGLNELQDVFSDANLPLTGPYSIVGRSVVVHYTNGSRMRCANIRTNTDTEGQWAMAKAVFNTSLNGTVMMRQQVFPDGSSMDTTVEVAFNISSGVNTTNATLYIMTNRIGESGCSENGGVYNPFNMTNMSSTCSKANPLSCVIGEFSLRQDPLNLTQRQVYTDSRLPLTGDFTVVHRSLAIMSGDTIIACADILPESSSAEQTFPRVTNFSRYDFRSRVADVLQLQTSRVTILPGSPQSADNEECQKVNFMVAGDVDPELLNSVKTSEKMGLFQESDQCLKNVSTVQFIAPLNMGGVTGQVQFDSVSQMATLNISGAGSCSSLNLSLTEFPVMYGNVAQPCSESHIGRRIFNFSADGPNSTVSVSELFSNRSRLDDYSLIIRTCDGTEVCAVVIGDQKLLTRQARFTGSIAGNVYLRYTPELTNQWLLMDLVRVDLFGVDQIDTNNVVISGSSSTAANCEEFLQNINSPPLNNLSEVALSPTMRPQKVRLDLNNSNENTRFFVFSYGTVSQCAQIDDLPGKQVSAMINMKGIKGYFKFQQDSPFSVTELTVNLTNLQSKVGPYHVHLFPVPSLRNPLSSLCSNDNIGGHFNPFGLNTTDPNYPQGPGSTHDRYEIGDLGTKHMSLAGLTEFEGVFEDYNLPLYGQNSIVGRSVVIHELNGARYVCASISYPGEVVVAKATFLSPVVGEVWFTQLKNHHLSDVSVFLDLSYGNPATAPTQNHNWHVHTYPISSERDDSVGRCTTTGGHWNPYGVDTENMNYSMFCSSESPFSCEVGDFTGKFTTLNLSVNVGRVEAKHFFTDVTSWVPGIAGRSIVIHQAERAGPRIACANVTTVRTSNASLRTWYGPGMSNGDIQFTQSLPLGPTEVNVSLTNLNSLAGGYHVHILPIISGQSNPCSDANIRGHFNPLNWDIQNSPAPGVGTLDQYEVGDLSGKFGMLTGLNELQDVFSDANLPLTGPYSIVGRSVVVHYTNGSRMRCANIRTNTDTEGQWAMAKAVFNTSLNGTVTMRQQVFPDGSSMDTTVEVAFNISSGVNTTNPSMYIMTSRIGERGCSENGEVYNPFNMTNMSSTCSKANPLSCVIGEFSLRQDPLNLTQRQVYTDSRLPLTGDFTVVHRSLAIMSGDTIIACADILPESSSAEQTFPRVTNFSRYDFRSRVADVLQLQTSRVTILPGSPQSADNEECQKVNFMVAGDVDPELLNSVKTSETMGLFRESDQCLRAASLLLQPGKLLVFVVAVVLLL
ncbi:hypothetical protein NQD34_000301 [Periophthalmus magnuspinnatus]|nr:hypothetical protein NQD34_000301 [Periophthalmus magnuspinnatus]